MRVGRGTRISRREVAPGGTRKSVILRWMYPRISTSVLFANTSLPGYTVLLANFYGMYCTYTLNNN